MTSSVPPRTYGGWRRSRGIGLLGLGPVGSVMVLVAVLSLLVSAAFSLQAFIVLAGPVLVVIASCVVRVGGVPVAEALVQRLRWWAGSLKGQSSYRAGVVVEHPRAWQLPGVLAPTRLISAEDGYGGHYGIVIDRRRGVMTATLRCAATSTWLADPGDAEGWVANWGAWLAGLGYTPAIRWVAVTVATAPDPGSTLADQISARISPNAPAAAVALMEQLVAASPSASADVDTWVSITFDSAALPAKPKDVDAAVAEFGRTLHGLQTSLATCGVTVLGRASATEIAGMVRTAFDPSSRGEVNRLISSPHAPEVLTWADAGPVGAEEAHDHYAHDSGVSVSYSWSEAPRQHVHSGVLSNLLAPGSWPKRVTLLYRPYSAGAAARLLEAQVNATSFRAELNRRQRKDPTARDLDDAARARQAAEEEATGAGVSLVSLYVTVTAHTTEDLAAACADVQARADSAKIRLRRMFFSQAAGFATTLPCGICPPVLAKHWPR